MTTTNDYQGFTLTAKGGTVNIDIFDVIGEDFWGEGVSAKNVASALKPHKSAKQIDVHINSPGGSAFDGIAIYNTLHQHKANVTVYVDGMALSAASIIAMAGDDIRMAENSMMMIHNSSGLTMGDADTHQQQVDLLTKLDGQLANTYAKRTGGNIKTIAEQMDDETWFTAEEAVADGFATEVTPAKTVAAHFNPDLMNKFNNVPECIRPLFQSTTTSTVPVTITKEVIPMADDKLTADQIKDKYPDAVKDWVNEGFKEGHDEASKEFTERMIALSEAFKDRPAFALEQCVKGNDVPRAKADLADVLLAEKQDDAKTIADLQKNQGGDGHKGPLALAQTTVTDNEADDDKYESMDEEDRIDAMWDDKHPKAKKYETKAAFAAGMKHFAKRSA